LRDVQENQELTNRRNDDISVKGTVECLDAKAIEFTVIFLHYDTTI
jgi:hypothetical protein